MSLVTPGEGREDTRARITLPADPTVRAVVETFAGSEARLIVTGDAAGSRSVEVSHEALIRHWEKLRHWVDENRENLRTRAALLADQAEWLKQDKDRSLLIEPGLRLEAARKLRDQPGDVVVDDIKDYIDASLAREARRRLVAQCRPRRCHPGRHGHGGSFLVRVGQVGRCATAEQLGTRKRNRGAAASHCGRTLGSEGARTGSRDHPPGACRRPCSSRLRAKLRGERAKPGLGRWWR